MLRSDDKCFVCGQANRLGMQVDFTVHEKAKIIEAEYTFSSVYQGYAGRVHGGILSCLLDEAMVKLAFELGYPAVTGEITVRFPAPLGTGVAVRVTGRLVRVERRIITAESRAVTEGGDVVAEGRARLFRPKDSR
ncbi:MAG: PaaI family thioesterase [bacterium]|nr:PaaI family thioesterase [bacterium]